VPTATAEPISLYLELEPGQTADLEVVARAALAFAAAIREAAFVLDPSLEISLGFESGTEGSLSLNSIIRSIKNNTKLDPATIKTLIIMVIFWFSTDIRQWTVQEGLKSVQNRPAKNTIGSRDQQNRGITSETA
jgi:hypothetical protein